MRAWFTTVILFAVTFAVNAQTVTTAPAVPSAAQPVTITFDVSGTDFGSKNLNEVWLWSWLENGASDINAPTNVNPATAGQDAAKVTRSSTNPNVYSITLTATEFFGRSASEINTVGVLLKGRDWSDGQTSDKFITFTESFSVAFAEPASSAFLVDPSATIEIRVNTNEAAVITLKKGDDILASSSGEVQEFSYSLTVAETQGSVTITADANNAIETKTASFTYVIRTPTEEAARPAGIIDGINYSTDPSKVTLGLWAPGKNSVYVLGEFNDWRIASDFQMKRDGEHFWLEITGLTAGKEYAFQYLVDEHIKIADPYADKILDPDDAYIPATSYPDLKPFPPEALSDEWYFNRLAVLQTDQAPYEWAVPDFEKPAKEDLVIYELLVRDFFDSGHRNYQTLIDTLDYIKRLGVNAIELMPVMEFNGNEGWGYNPTFMFAPDKYYGRKNKLREFVDQCHERGIAVILDIVMNHHDIPNPYLMMDFDFVNFKPEADNMWFNVTATHPFNVFFDMNHESPYTRNYLDTVNYYWINEYHVDGFRYDLSKGFTQTYNPDNVAAWSSYDASRIMNLERMADKVWEYAPDAYIILEHLAANDEEKVLAEYRAGEGKGMLLWGKMTDPYNQLTMGYVENSDISAIDAEDRGWSVAHLVGYMESHDEERLMVKDLLYGNSAASYSAADTLTSLARIRAASTLFLTVPGPKMLWQFEELGYDYSINECPDGSTNPDCRISPKPVRWNYRADSHRYWLYDHMRDLIRLRKTYDLFTRGSADFSGTNSLAKQLVLKNSPYTASPSGPEEMNAVIVANFDVVERDVAVEFPHGGTWFDYYHGGEILVDGHSKSLAFPPGGYKLFTDVALESTVVTGTEAPPDNVISLYPNPVGDVVRIDNAGEEVIQVSLLPHSGDYIPVKRLSDKTWDVSAFPPGFYIVEVKTRARAYRVKMIKL